MPRNKKNVEKKSSPKSEETPMQKLNLDVLLKEAEAYVDTFNYDEAAEKLNEILKVDSNNIEALEILAGVYIEQSNWMEAENLLQKAIHLLPDTGHAKYFSMGQLSDGEESLRYYQKGIDIIKKELENSENITPVKKTPHSALIRSLSDAYCSVSEIFMTDCCFADNAEESCKTAIENAITSDQSNPEAHQCLANFYLVKEDIERAKEAVQKSLSLWLPQHEALRDGLDQEAALEAENLIPSYDCRIKTSKLLIELEMFDEASNILEGLLEEDDEVVEVWYLLGWMNYIQGDEYKLNAHYYLKKAQEVHKKTGMEEADYISHIHELLEELQDTFPLTDLEDKNEECLSDLSSDSEENKMET